MKSLGYIGTLSAAILLSACGGSSGGGSNDGVDDPKTDDPVVVESGPVDPDPVDPDPVNSEPCGDQISLTFPAAYSATLSKNITVRGTADCASIDGIEINGVAAASSDDFNNWQANITLQSGRNSIVAKVTEGDNNQEMTLAAIESNELLYSPDQVAATKDGTALYVFDTSRRHLLKIDTETGARSVVSSTSYPNQDHYFGNISAITLSQDETLMYLVSRNVGGITNGSDGAVLAVNLETGVRSLISNPDVANQDKFRDAESMVHDAANKRLILSSEAEIYTVQLDEAGTLGEQTLISSNTVPDANNPFTTYSIQAGQNLLTFANGIRIALDTDNQRLIVSDQGRASDNNEQILAVNLNPGASFGTRSIISGPKDEWREPGPIVVKDGISGYFYDTDADNNSKIFSINLKDGSTALVLDSSLQTDLTPIKNYRKYLTYAADTGMLYTTSDDQKSVFAINIAEQKYSVLSENLASAVTGFTEVIDDISRNALDQNNQHLYLTADKDDILRLNLKTGAREAFITNINGEDSGSSDLIESMSFDERLQAVIVTGNRDGDTQDIGYVKTFSATDGTETLITDSIMDTGSDFRRPWDWVRLNDTTAIVVDDTSSPSKYFSTNIETGVRTQIDVDLSAVPDDLETEDMEISLDKSALYVTDDSSDGAGLYKLDLNTNVMSVVTDATTPAGDNLLRLNDPESLAMSSDGQHVYVGDNSEGSLFKINLATGQTEALISDAVNSVNSWAERIQGIAVDNERQLIYTSCDNADVVLMVDELSKEWVMIAE